jgi:putative transposase
MRTHGVARLRRFARRCVGTVRARISGWTKPRPLSLATGVATDLVRRRHDLLLENAFLRQPVIVLSRTAKRPTFTPWDRGLLGLFASQLRTWAGGLLIVQPETVLRWHRQGFRHVWRRTSTPRTQPLPLAPATIDLSKRMARDNRRWTAERLRGELLTLDIRVSKRTIQKYMREVPRARPPGQAWALFLRNHVPAIWACDFLQVPALPCRPLFACFLVEHGSRRVVHVGVTRHPTDDGVTQQ